MSNGFWGEDEKPSGFTPHGIVDSSPPDIGPAIVPTGIAGDQPSTPYAASDQGSMMAAELQNAGHSSVPITDKEMAEAQSQVNQAVAQAMYATKGLSAEEREAAVQDAVGKVALPPQLGAQQIAQMTEQAVKVNQDAVISGGQEQTQTAEAQKESPKWVTSLMAFLAPLLGMVNNPNLSPDDQRTAVAAGTTIGERTEGRVADMGEGTKAMGQMQGLAFDPGPTLPGKGQTRGAEQALA